MKRPPSLETLRTAQNHSLGHLLFTAARLLDEAGQRCVNELAGAPVARPALMRLLPLLTEDGARIADMARRLDVSKQAVQKTVAELTELGLVELEEDPTDSRAKRVKLSAFGIKASHHGLAVLAGLEAELRARAGAQAVDALFDALTQLLPALASPDLGERFLKHPATAKLRRR